MVTPSHNCTHCHVAALLLALLLAAVLALLLAAVMPVLQLPMMLMT